jgi:hypothetical protein
VENFLLVQPVELRTAPRSRNPAQIRSRHRPSPSSCTAAWTHCETRLDHLAREDTGKYRASRRRTESRRSASPRGAARKAASFRKHVPKMKDPSGGTTGRVKPYGALGVDGRSRRIQPMGRDNRSHINKSQHPGRTFKTPTDFFSPVLGAVAAKSLRSRLFRSVCGRFVRRHRRRGVV